MRALEKENALNKAIIDILLSQKEYLVVRDNAIYDEDSRNYTIRPFILKEKEVRFPKLPF